LIGHLLVAEKVCVVLAEPGEHPAYGLSHLWVLVVKEYQQT